MPAAASPTASPAAASPHCLLSATLIVLWVASDGWQLNLALVAAVAEDWLSHRAACPLT